MTRKKTIVAAVTLAAAVSVPVAALAGSNDDPAEREVPITGKALDTAKAAALAETGGGRVTGTEVGDEDSYYEVEVTLDDGTQVDIQLDESFAVVGSAPDVEND